MSELIKPEHREAIELVAATSLMPAVRRRAALLLHYDAGHATAAVAEHVGLSTSTVLRWRRQYREQGLGIFPAINLNHPAPAVSTSAQPELAKEAVSEKPKTKKEGGKGKKRKKQMKKEKEEKLKKGKKKEKANETEKKTKKDTKKEKGKKPKKGTKKVSEKKKPKKNTKKGKAKKTEKKPKKGTKKEKAKKKK